ncbi:hypothetical protein P8452_30808 [Trifolium repens]|nr:hypothetical protein P8452_30808 [Trifolium repens]
MIPNNLGNLTKLSYLDLSLNSYLHSDDIYWLSKLSLLENLYLRDVFLGRVKNLFMVLNMIPSLKKIDLRNCSLTKMQSDDKLVSYSNFSSIESLILADNRLDGLDLNVFRNISSSIEFLNLSNNSLSSVPFWLGNCAKLSTFYFRSNALNGSLPSPIRNLTSLTLLNLSQNNIESIPLWLGSLQNLLYLNLSWNHVNHIESSLTSILGNMCHLLSLDLSGNKLKGDALVGNLQSTKCTVFDLQELVLTNNNFNDQLPTWLGQLENLVNLILHSSFFHGPIPKNFEKLSNLQYLILGNNNLNGTIPNTLGKLRNLTMLDISNNKLFGGLPKNLGKLSNLFYLLLGNNLINDSIPNSLCLINSLYNLDLSRNKLVGNIPDCWNSTQRLNDINLSFNKLSGVIPNSFGHLLNLVWLHLNNNNFHGEFPSFLKNLKQLLILDIGENQMSGTIPSWIGDIFSMMQIMRLSKNKFQGKIPLQLCKLSALQVLDLSNNLLMGSIPQCIGNLTAMIHAKKPSIVVEETRDFNWDNQGVSQIIKGREDRFTRIGLQLAQDKCEVARLKKKFTGNPVD